MVRNGAMITVSSAAVPRSSDQNDPNSRLRREGFISNRLLHKGAGGDDQGFAVGILEHRAAQPLRRVDGGVLGAGAQHHKLVFPARREFAKRLGFIGGIGAIGFGIERGEVAQVGRNYFEAQLDIAVPNDDRVGADDILDGVMLRRAAGAEADFPDRDVEAAFEHGGAQRHEAQFDREEHEREEERGHHHEFERGGALFVPQVSANAPCEGPDHWVSLSCLTLTAMVLNTVLTLTVLALKWCDVVEAHLRNRFAALAWPPISKATV